MTVPAPIVTECLPWKMTVSEMVAVGSALRGAFGGPVGVPELDEERIVADGGLRVAIVAVHNGGALGKKWLG